MSHHDQIESSSRLVWSPGLSRWTPRLPEGEGGLEMDSSWKALRSHWTCLRLMNLLDTYSVPNRK